MRMRIPRTRTAIILGVGMALGLGSWGCGRGTPTAPTPVGQVIAPGVADAGGAAGSGGALGGARPSSAPSAPMTVSWACFSGDGAGGLESSIACAAPRFALSAQVSAPFTAAPINLQRLVQGTTVVLTWNPPPGPDQPTSYVVEAGTNIGSSNITTFDTGSTATSLTVTNVPNGAYYVRVRARDGSGPGPASNEVLVIVGPPPGPGACSNPAGAPTSLAATVIGAAIALRWLPPSGCAPDGYLIGVGSAPGASDVARILTGDGTSYAISGVSPGTYHVFVRAVAGATTGPMSNIIAVTVTGIVPPGTTTWIGLFANGEGILLNDPECPPTLGLDLTATFVESGGRFTGIGTVTVRHAPGCPDAVGFSDTQPIIGAASGLLASGSGTITATIGSGSDSGTLNGTFANGRMTGTIVFLDDGAVGTFVMNRQSQ
ncbi:MAG: fibronectin type III domain-containing protein [Acidobacteriota bacterium]